mmetsp:Transcript_13500/g.35937  ORF Transcript_13500/g.35937 Transcript_13500/m.35937 type:complete len:419 (-) Transcript_13500:13-1269(-)
MVGVGEHLASGFPRGGPSEAVLVHEEAHELDDGDGGVGVVELDGDLGVELGERAVLLEEAADGVLEGGAHEEVLLLEAELLARVGGIVGIEHGRDLLGLLLGGDGGVVVALGEGVEVELLGRLGVPQAQVECVVGVIAGDRGVVRDGLDDLAPCPLPALAVVLKVTEEADGIGDVETLDLPRVAVDEPVVGDLNLVEILDLLLEHAILVADAVAPAREVESGEGIHEAGSETAEAAISEAGIALLGGHGLEVEADAVKGLLELGVDADVHESVGEVAAHEEFEGEVVHALDVLLGEVVLGVVPRLDEAVADGVGGGLVGAEGVEVVAGAGESVLNVGDDLLLDGEDVAGEVLRHEPREELVALLVVGRGGTLRGRRAGHGLVALLGGGDGALREVLEGRGAFAGERHGRVRGVRRIGW